MSAYGSLSEDEYREQVRREVEREMAVGSRNTVVVERKNDNLSKEVDSHRCPICIELMLYPNYSPLMLVPCGHTFCSKCLSKYQQTAKSVCPLCRSKITSTVPNHSLRCIIEAYAYDTINSGSGGQKVRLHPSFESAIEHHSDPDNVDQIRDYVSMYTMAEARSKVLVAEQQTSKDEHSNITKTIDVDKQVAAYLINEQHQLNDQITKLSNELKMVQSQLIDRQEAIKAGGEVQLKLEDRIQELDKSITTIDRESLKAKTIVGHLAPDLDLDAIE